MNCSKSVWLFLDCSFVHSNPAKCTRHPQQPTFNHFNPPYVNNKLALKMTVYSKLIHNPKFAAKEAKKFRNATA
jgi:hypothetical protein